MADQTLTISMQRYNTWLESGKLTEEEKNELLGIKDNTEEIEQHFCSYLSFGTAGLRGTMAMGTNNMNIYTVCHASQGFANYIRSCGINDAAERGIVIAYDSRLNSEKFAHATAAVMANSGIKVFLFDGIRPTPELSFAVRRLGTIAGVNITASHNPKQYNGYKAYWEDGAQLGPEQADAVSEQIINTDIFKDVNFSDGDYERAIESGKITSIGSEIDEDFLAQVAKQPICPDVVKQAADKLKIVYTPLYGTGYKLVPEAMRRLGIKNLYTVSEQMTPDGNFPTTPFPNPELPQVFEHAIKLADEKGADIIIGNDPDADRTGAMIRGNDGKFMSLSGNQIGAMLLDYIISAKKEFGSFPENAFAVKSIVTTDIVTKICAIHRVKLYDVLTGFKFIGKVVSDYETETGRSADSDFLLGFEESNGFMKGTYLRDKDAVCTTVLLCEMAAYYQIHGKTLYNALCDMYDRYGLYKEHTTNIYMEGLDGLARMKNVMARLHSNIPSELGGEKIRFLRNYLSGTVTDVKTGEKTGTGLPKSDVLLYETENGNKIVIRPSGTEPKIKIYYLLHSESGDQAALDALLDACMNSMKELTQI